MTSSAHAQFSNVDPVQAVHAVQQINQGVQLYSTTREQLQNVIDNYNLAPGSVADALRRYESSDADHIDILLRPRS